MNVFRNAVGALTIKARITHLIIQIVMDVFRNTVMTLPIKARITKLMMYILKHYNNIVPFQLIFN